MGERPTQSRKRGQGGNSPLAGSRGGAPLWGLGQRPNCFSGAQLQGSPQQRCRQRSVPASNFAHPQMRPPTCSTHPSHIVAPNGRDRVSVISYFIMLLLKCRDFATVEATRSLSLAPRPLRRALPCFLFFLLLAFSCGRRIRTIGGGGTSAQSLLPSESCPRALSGASPLTFCR